MIDNHHGCIVFYTIDSNFNCRGKYSFALIRGVYCIVKQKELENVSLRVINLDNLCLRTQRKVTASGMVKFTTTSRPRLITRATMELANP